MVTVDTPCKRKIWNARNAGRPLLSTFLAALVALALTGRAIGQNSPPLLKAGANDTNTRKADVPYLHYATPEIVGVVQKAFESRACLVDVNGDGRLDMIYQGREHHGSGKNLRHERELENGPSSRMRPR